MSRSGYSGDCDNWDLIRWRGAVNSAIRGKRGQALLKEMEAALLALPTKELCHYDFANVESMQVCALGAVELKRRMDAGKHLYQALVEIAKEFPEGTEADSVADHFGIADAMAKEITYINDEGYVEGPRHRYETVLRWVRENIKKQESK